jgi:hypothetical protein
VESVCGCEVTGDDPILWMPLTPLCDEGVDEAVGIAGFQKTGFDL